MKTEELKIISIDWSGTNPVLTLKNTGSASLTVTRVTVNGASATMSPSSITMTPGNQTTVTVSGISWTSGTKYTFVFYTATGNSYQYVSVKP
jgi:P pilus assembly chaperone PapD